MQALGGESAPSFNGADRVIVVLHVLEMLMIASETSDRILLLMRIFPDLHTEGSVHILEPCPGFVPPPT